jgi:hypothetical protein
MRCFSKEAYHNEAFQEIHARGCNKKKPESNIFRIAVEKQAGTRGDTKITEDVYDVPVSSCSQKHCNSTS